VSHVTVPNGSARAAPDEILFLALNQRLTSNPAGISPAARDATPDCAGAGLP